MGGANDQDTKGIISLAAFSASTGPVFNDNVYSALFVQKDSNSIPNLFFKGGKDGTLVNLTGALSGLEWG